MDRIGLELLYSVSVHPLPGSPPNVLTVAGKKQEKMPSINPTASPLPDESVWEYDDVPFIIFSLSVVHCLHGKQNNTNENKE